MAGHPTKLSSPELVRRYEAIGGVSPLAERTAAQVEGIRQALEVRAPGRYVVAFGAKHTAPLIEDTAAGLQGHDRVIALVLTPHASSMGSQEYLDRARSALGTTTEFVPVGPWYGEPALVTLLADRVRTALFEVAELGRTHPRVIFTAHSLPARSGTAWRHLPGAIGRLGPTRGRGIPPCRIGKWRGRARHEARSPGSAQMSGTSFAS